MSDFKKYIEETPDFPVPGVLFRNINPLLSNPPVFQKLTQEMMALLSHSDFDSFIGIESRGFILASALAIYSKKGFVPLRKAGKLPPPIHQENYSLEYGTATLEIASGQGKIVIVDDVLATGGTLKAAQKLCEKAGYQVVDMLVLVNIKTLNQFRFQGREIKSLIHYE